MKNLSRIKLLEQEIAEFPITINEDYEYINEVDKRVRKFIEFLEFLKYVPYLKKYSQLIDNAIFKTNDVLKNIKEAFYFQFRGEQTKSVQILKRILKEDDNLFRATIFDSYAFSNVYYYERKPITSLYLFKGRVDFHEPFKDFTSEEMFHIPLNKRNLIKTQRYSLPGIPCIYLAQNSYIVWKELQMPNFDNLSISAFNIIDGNKEIIDLSYPYKIVIHKLLDENEFYKEYISKGHENEMKFIFNNLSLYPIRVAVSVKCKDAN